MTLLERCDWRKVMEALRYAEPDDTIGSIEVYFEPPDAEGCTALYLNDAIAAALAKLDAIAGTPGERDE